MLETLWEWNLWFWRLEGFGLILVAIVWVAFSMPERYPPLPSAPDPANAIQTGYISCSDPALFAEPQSFHYENGIRHLPPGWKVTKLKPPPTHTVKR